MGNMLQCCVASGHVAANALEKIHLRFLKQWCRLRDGVPGWAIYCELGELPFHFHWGRGLFSFWNQVVTVDDASVWKQILVDAYGLTSKSSWGAQVHRFLELYSLQLADDPFAYALEIKDIAAAMLQSMTVFLMV